MQKLIILSVLATLLKVNDAAKLYVSGILTVDELGTICCLKGYRAYSIRDDVEIKMVYDWNDFRDGILDGNSSTSKNSLILMHHVDEDLLLSAAHVHRSLMSSSRESVVWLPKTPSDAVNTSLGKYNFMLAEIVVGSFEDTPSKLLMGQVLPNSNTISYVSEIFSCLQACIVFGLGILLRYTRASKQVEEIMHARETSKFKKLTREEAIRKLGAWSGVNISYTAGVVLLGIQEVCIMLMIVYYFHWVSYLLKLAFIIAFSTSADLIYDDLIEAGPDDIELPYFGSSNLRRTLFRACLIGTGITWYMVRKHQYAWILHNLMASIMCIAIVSDVSLPSMVTICFFAVLLAVYDLFMVFVTPKFTADGVSVMESAVLGTDGDVMPMVMYTPKFPSLTKYPQCASTRTGFLGLGDIIIPGVIGSYCANFDAMRMRDSKTKMSYLAFAAYVLGLITTYVFRELMDTAQPALIYIIPMMLLVLLPGAVVLDIWSNFWHGRLRDTHTKSAKKN